MLGPSGLAMAARASASAVGFRQRSENSHLRYIQGTVSDSTGAALPKATVTVRNLDTGATVSTETTDAGLYSAPNLPPWRYAVTVDAAKFKQCIKVALTV